MKKIYLTAPVIRNWRPLFLNADDLSHVLVGRVSGDKVMIGQLIVLYNTCKENKNLSEWILVNKTSYNKKKKKAFWPPEMQRRAISQRIRPKLYMSAIIKDWKVLLFKVSSNTSGGMYRFVPTRRLRGMSTSLVSLKHKMKTNLFFHATDNPVLHVNYLRL